MASAEKQLHAENENGDAVGALKDADVIIGHNMAEPEGHLLAFMAYRELNKADDAAYQHKSVEAWVKSPATAFIVVGEGEEYFYLNAIMGYRFPSSQSLVQRDGHSYDLMKIKDRAGADQEVWFNVDVSMAASKDALGNAKK